MIACAERKTKTLVVDAEFQALLPPQTAEENADLEAKLLAEGCADAVSVWAGTRIILDGHHRYALCKKHGITFRTREVNVEGRDGAMLWIIQHQFARRNLTPFQRGELALKLQPILRARARDNQRAAGAGKEVKHPIDVATEIGKVAGLNRSLASRTRFITAHSDEPHKQALREGKTTISAEYFRLKGVEEGDRGWAERRKFKEALEAIRSYEAPSGQSMARTIDHLQELAALALVPKRQEAAEPERATA